MKHSLSFESFNEPIDKIKKNKTSNTSTNPYNIPLIVCLTEEEILEINRLRDKRLKRNLFVVDDPLYFLKFHNDKNACFANVIIQALLCQPYIFHLVSINFY